VVAWQLPRTAANRHAETERPKPAFKAATLALATGAQTAAYARALCCSSCCTTMYSGPLHGLSPMQSASACGCAKPAGARRQKHVQAHKQQIGAASRHPEQRLRGPPPSIPVAAAIPTRPAANPHPATPQFRKGLLISDPDIVRTVLTIFWLIAEPGRLGAGYYGNLQENVREAGCNNWGLRARWQPSASPLLADHSLKAVHS
jgi:hypothetical protein